MSGYWFPPHVASTTNFEPPPDSVFNSTGSYWCFQVTQDNQDTAMLKKEHQMRIMDDALELMKREFAARMEEVARKESRLSKVR